MPPSRARISTCRFLNAVVDPHRPHPQVEISMTRGVTSVRTNPSLVSASPCGQEYGSVRKSWRGYIHHLAPFPKLQQLALDTANLFTKPDELDFHFPRTFHRKYVLGEKVGEGAFGDVYRAVPRFQDRRGRALQLDLAVKVVAKSRIGSRHEYAAVKQEGRIMGLLGGTLNVVHFFGAYEDTVNVYLIMERCVGGDVSSRVVFRENNLHGRANPKQEERAKRYMKEILHVVWQCHVMRIVHRDLKLENFLFADTRDDSPLKLTDFGGAALLEEGEVLSDLCGTPLYTAPEVLKRNYAFPSDVWSCGVILYRLLCGRFPFESGQLLDERILHEELDLESPPWTGISIFAKDLVKRLMERDVAKRLTAAQALHHPWLAPSAPLPAQASSRACAAAKEATKRMAGPVLHGTLVQKLQLYRSLNSLQRAVLHEIMRLLPLALKEDVLVLYTEISRDGRESVGLEEFAVYVAARGYRLTRGEAKGFLRNLDLDGDGRLSRGEFCAALLDWPLIQSQQRGHFVSCADQVFDRIDQDQDGLLTVQDVAHLTPFRENGNHLHSFRNDLHQCFQYADRSGRGNIDKVEFMHMLRIPPGAYATFPKRAID